MGNTNNQKKRIGTEADGFFKDGHTTRFYLKQLAKLGCPEDLLALAKEVTDGKHTDREAVSEDGVDRYSFKWDGSRLYVYQGGSWGFNRINIEPESNGYVDFGFGYPEEG